MAFSTDAAFDFLRRAHSGQRLAHAYLITGEPGSGKRALAFRLARLVQGLPDADEAMKGQTDLTLIEPESKSRLISVEQMRNLEQALQLRASSGRMKVGIVFDADRMNVSAANSFLKTLEEPPAHSLLLLLTAHPEMLLDTILSRCIPVQLMPPALRTLSPQQEKLLELIAQFFRMNGPGIGPVFVLVREFVDLLGETKGEAQKQSEESLKQEQALYKQSTDGKWLEGRETHFKAVGEAAYLQQRNVIVGTLLQWWGDILRQQNGGAALDFPAYAEITAGLAGRFTPAEVLRRIEAIEGLRDNFGRNVQEQLAIEVAFIDAFKL